MSADGMTFEVAKRNAIAAAVDAQAVADSMLSASRSQPVSRSVLLAQRVVALAKLASAWADVADVIDTEHVREQDAKAEAEYEAQKAKHAASGGVELM